MAHCAVHYDLTRRDSQTVFWNFHKVRLRKTFRFPCLFFSRKRLDINNLCATAQITFFHRRRCETVKLSYVGWFRVNNWTLVELMYPMTRKTGTRSWYRQ